MGLFEVGWDAALIAVKAISYATTLGAAGAVFFLGFCGALLVNAEAARIRRIMLSLAVLSVCAGGAQIIVTAGSMGGDMAGMLDGSLLHMVLQAGAGRGYALRVVGLALAAFGLAAARPRWWSPVGAALAATSFAWTGHASSLKPHAAPVVLLCVHLLGVAFWLGALSPLLIVAAGKEPLRLAAAATRFGAAGVFVVGGLIIAGGMLLWMLLGDYGALWSSSYGRWVLLKLALVAGILCLAALNKLRLTPRLAQGGGQSLRNLRSLRVSIRLEILLAGLILAVTAIFTTLTGPPRLGSAGGAPMRLQCDSRRCSSRGLYASFADSGRHLDCGRPFRARQSTSLYEREERVQDRRH